jgi:hypothetical protein
MHSEVDNNGKMMRKQRSIKNLKELQTTIKAYYHFNFFRSYSESNFICPNLLVKEFNELNSKILQNNESINCMANFLSILNITRNLLLMNSLLELLSTRSMGAIKLQI